MGNYIQNAKRAYRSCESSPQGHGVLQYQVRWFLGSTHSAVKTWRSNEWQINGKLLAQAKLLGAVTNGKITGKLLAQ